MRNFTKLLAANLTLAVAPLAAHAQSAPVRIQVADLDLNSPAGLSAFQARAERTQRVFCDAGGQSLSARDACRAAVRAEIAEKLALAPHAQLASRGQVLAVR
jgi:UrcA family protein